MGIKRAEIKAECDNNGCKESARFTDEKDAKREGWAMEDEILCPNCKDWREFLPKDGGHPFPEGTKVVCVKETRRSWTEWSRGGSKRRGSYTVEKGDVKVVRHSDTILGRHNVGFIERTTQDPNTDHRSESKGVIWHLARCFRYAGGNDDGSS